MIQLQENWLEVAKNLKEGRSTRINCVFPNCNDDRQSLKIVHDAKGYNCYCFDCKASKFQGHGMRSISKLKLFESTEQFYSTPKLPQDFTLCIPPVHAVWLYKAGIFASTAAEYGIGWSASMQRVILPIYKKGKLVYTQARAVIEGMQPKYLNKANANRARIMFRSAWSKRLLSLNVACINEDILSAIRVGLYLNAYSTLGTELTDEAAFILSKYKAILIWYDADKGGAEGAIKARKKLQSIGVPAFIYTGTKDPKYYTNEELVLIINDCLRRFAHDS